MKIDTKKITKLALLSAMGIILVVLVHFPILPSASFLEYDPSDTVILIASFMFGPIAGVLVTFIISLIQWIFVSAQSGFWGFLMHFVASGTLAFVAGAIYKRKRSFKGACVSLILGSFAMVLVMIPINMLVTPLYTGAPLSAIIKLLLPAIIPFNAIKAFGNSIITLVLYKQIRKIFDRI